jgi:hypothetical protein
MQENANCKNIIHYLTKCLVCDSAQDSKEHIILNCKYLDKPREFLYTLNYKKKTIGHFNAEFFFYTAQINDKIFYDEVTNFIYLAMNVKWNTDAELLESPNG